MLWCGDLNELSPIFLGIWTIGFPPGSSSWVGLGDVALLEELYHWEWDWGFKNHALIPIFSLHSSIYGSRCESSTLSFQLHPLHLFDVMLILLDADGLLTFWRHKPKINLPAYKLPWSQNFIIAIETLLRYSSNTNSKVHWCGMMVSILSIIF